MNKIIIKKINGDLIFSHEQDNNTIKKTLENANLSDANLSDADLSGAKNIPQSYINICSHDLLYIFHTLKAELPQLREKLVKGEINGSQYEGSCVCLIGSLSNIKNMKPQDFCKSLLPYYDMGLHNPGEQLFYQIHSGDTPKNSFFAKHAVKLINEVLTNTEKSTF